LCNQEGDISCYQGFTIEGASTHADVWDDIAATGSPSGHAATGSPSGHAATCSPSGHASACSSACSSSGHAATGSPSDSANAAVGSDPASPGGGCTSDDSLAGRGITLFNVEDPLSGKVDVIVGSQSVQSQA
jgi:hypothetical protein